MDKLQFLIQTQRQFMDIVGIEPNNQFTEETVLFSGAFLSAAIGLASESVEVLNLHNTKSRPWKTVGELGERIYLTKEELIDVFFYGLEIANILHMDEVEIVEMYKRKFAINCARVIDKRHSPEERRKLIEYSISQVSLEDVDVPEGSLQTESVKAGIFLVTWIDSKLGDNIGMEEIVEKLTENPVEFVRSIPHEPGSSDLNLRSL